MRSSPLESAGVGRAWLAALLVPRATGAAQAAGKNLTPLLPRRFVLNFWRRAAAQEGGGERAAVWVGRVGRCKV